jgi:hypothetical protein
MHAVGWALIVGGVVLTIVGIVILILAVVQLIRQMCGHPATAGHVTFAANMTGINVADLTKLIEAIIKIPQWLLAILAGDLQIWFGYWLATGSRLF